MEYKIPGDPANTIQEMPDGGLRCSCGAKCPPKGRERFRKRHPVKCSRSIQERKDFAHQLAQGTRSVDGDSPSEPTAPANPSDRTKLIIHYFQVLVDEGRNLTSWESQFLDDLRWQWKEKEWMSEKQLGILERIYNDRT